MPAKKMAVTNCKGRTYECFVDISVIPTNATKYQLAQELSRLRLKRTPKGERPNVVTIKTDGPHWLWRTCPPYRLTASGICVSYKGVKKNDS